MATHNNKPYIAMSAGSYKTPGVYIIEENAFPNSVVSVNTAVPAFIGYTEKAVCNNKPLLNKPFKITSFSAFVEYFGGMRPPVFTLAKSETGTLRLSTGNYVLAIRPGSLFYLYNSIRLFYQNGGGTAYIVSVGDYSSTPDAAALACGIDTLNKEAEPTMLLAPDALLLSEEAYYSTVQKMLGHCQEAANKIAILDVYRYTADGTGEADKPEVAIAAFRNNVGFNGLSYGAAYYPWLQASIMEKGLISFTNFEDLTPCFEETVAAEAAALIADYTKQPAASLEQQVHNSLLALSNNYKAIINAAMARLNMLPPAPAMAGVYTLIDNNRGVWKAPANVSLAAVVAPTVNITGSDQEWLNVDNSGKSVNAIRSFIGEGVLVWGARTLDGNSMDWRYINVRRTMIMLEQSIKWAVAAYVFEPNVASTWASVKSMISNYLTDVWKQGGLVGATPDDAFQVNVGLGTTMTGDDILNGYMNVTVQVAVTRPAEFIVLTFQQQQQTS